MCRPLGAAVDWDQIEDDELDGGTGEDTVDLPAKQTLKAAD